MNKKLVIAFWTTLSFLNIGNQVGWSQGGMAGSHRMCCMKREPFAPLPAVFDSKKNPITQEKVDLGRLLYYEPRLSKSQDVSCNSCHWLNQYGVDHRDASLGHNGILGSRNAPTVYNAAGHFVQFWDGRAPDVEEQAKGPVMNPAEMAMPSPEQVVTVLKSMPEYVAAFQKAFPTENDPVTFDNMAKAIGAFERKLVTPSRWDDFLKGKKTALTKQERAGQHTFMHVGCAACHDGMLIGANRYEKAGATEAWPNQADLGRFQVTKQPGDRMVFKVPSLRNIDQTSPYFHDASANTPEEAVSKMARHQLGVQLKDKEVQNIVAWLKTLTGPLPSEYVKEPVLPKSTDITPKPSQN